MDTTNPPFLVIPGTGLIVSSWDNKTEAETSAAALAEEHPDKAYVVYMPVSIFVATEQTTLVKQVQDVDVDGNKVIRQE